MAEDSEDGPWKIQPALNTNLRAVMFVHVQHGVTNSSGQFEKQTFFFQKSFILIFVGLPGCPRQVELKWFWDMQETL